MTTEGKQAAVCCTNGAGKQHPLRLATSLWGRSKPTHLLLLLDEL